MKNVYKFLLLTSIFIFQKNMAVDIENSKKLIYDDSDRDVIINPYEHRSPSCGVMQIMLHNKYSLSSIEECLSCEGCKKRAFTNLVHFIKKFGYKECKEIADLFIKHGISVDELDYIEETPLIVSCKILEIEAINFFISLVADVNKKNGVGETALIKAIRPVCGNVENINEVVKILLEAKADPNLPDDIIGYTPLMHAAKMNLKDVVYTLLIHGADPFKKDNQDKNFFDYAAGKPEFLAVYEKYKKEVESEMANGSID